MKFVDEYRDAALARRLLAQIAAVTTRPWVIMEICGGHTHAIIRHGLDRLLPARIELVHGPGCPVCVTPVSLVDKAITLALRSEVIFTSFGDMLRVPGSSLDQQAIGPVGRLPAAGERAEATIIDQGLTKLSGRRVPHLAASGTAMRTPVREPARSPQDAGPADRLPPKSLQQARAAGSDVRMVYSPLEAVELARKNPDRQVVFFAVGFETTAPGNAMAVLQAANLGLTNFSLLVSHVLVPPAISALLAAPDNRVQAFLAAGHVCTVMGWEEYEPLVEQYRVPIVPAGFEPVDILAAILMLVRQLEAGRAEVENEYTRSVRRLGNPAARRAVEQVFRVADRQWRGLGLIPASGLALRPEFAAFDAEERFDLSACRARESSRCLSGEILRGVMKPPQCPAFGRECRPETPLGATMVSNEGACSAYYTVAERKLG